jgi:Spy/CpxP family protein refolding chaperone
MHPGFFHHWRRARSCGHEARHAGHHGPGGPGYEAAGDHHGHGPGAGPMFGVRRPLRVMAHELELDDDQVERLARIIDELKTGRAQAAVDERKSVGLIADALLAADVDRSKLTEALDLRVRSAERLRDAVLEALSDTHGLLRPEQRKKLAYLLRAGQITI